MTATAATAASQPATGPRIWLVATARDWLGSEGERWIFVIKTLLAGFTALWLAYRLGLDAPGTSITTVFILALPSSGLVLEKAFYRLLGTLVGCLGALSLIALVPQQSVLLFAALALWVGLCTSGAALFRNAQSYSFVLAGYTACIIVIPAIDQPTQVFLAALARVTEVGLGILCSMAVNDALLPRHHGRHVMRTVEARYAGFIGFCQDALAHRLAPADIELAQLRFAADIAALESGRAAAFFEAAHARQDSRALHAFNAAFMTTLTTFYTLERLLSRLRRDADTAVLAALAPVHDRLGAALQADDRAALAALHAGLLAEAPLARAALAHDGAGPAQLIDVETALELCGRFAQDMQRFQVLHRVLTEGQRQHETQEQKPLPYTPKTPPMIVAASGLRAACAMLVLAAGWYYLAWPAAANAILIAVVFCALVSSSPRPNALVRQVLTGFLTAWPLALMTLYCVLAHASGYPMLVLSMLPVLVLGTYLNAVPKMAGIGIGINLFSVQMITPLNVLRLDPASFLNNALAMIVGVLLALVIFAVVLPGHTMGHKGYVGQALWDQTLQTCVAPLRGLRHRFGGRVRDLLSQLNAAAGALPDDATRAVVRQALTLLELGHSVIDMRALIDGSPGGPASDALRHCVRQIAAYLRRPAPAACQAALDAVLQAGPPVRAARLEADPARMQRLGAALADLHAIHASLRDQLDQPPAAPPAAPPSEGAPHAA